MKTKTVIIAMGVIAVGAGIYFYTRRKAEKEVTEDDLKDAAALIDAEAEKACENVPMMKNFCKRIYKEKIK